jgi:homoaconitate hydratase
VTSLQARGIALVIAGSYSQTYLRNAFNNAFICLESPALAGAMRERFRSQSDAGGRTIPAGPVTVDVRRSKATWDGRDYSVSPLGPAAQELVLAGGLEALTRSRLSR